MSTKIIHRLANMVKTGKTCEEEVRAVIVENLSPRHRLVYLLVNSIGPVTSTTICELLSDKVSIQQVGTLLICLRNLGLVQREKVNGSGRSYIYTVSPTRSSHPPSGR